MGPADFPPGEGINVRPHPHIGLCTITYLFDGEILHRDSLGYVQPIRPGAVNWMTAGRGIVHSERTAPEVEARDSRLFGIQAWIALPAEKEETEPAFEHYPEESLPRVTDQPGCEITVIAGQAYGAVSPVAVQSPLFYLEVKMQAGSSLTLPEEYDERACYLVSGSVLTGGETLEPFSMGLAERGKLPGPLRHDAGALLHGSLRLRPGAAHRGSGRQPPDAAWRGGAAGKAAYLVELRIQPQ